MKRILISRGVLGFPVGIAISYVITIIGSACWGDGYYSPCVPELIPMMGNEIKAVILQAVLSGLLGVGFAAGSVIWEMEEWSMLKQTGIYFLVISVIMLPTAYVTYWMEHSIRGFLQYFGIFALIYGVIWIVLFVTGRYNVKKMNESLSKTKGK